MFRESYTPEEWRTLQFAPLWSFTLIASVDNEMDKEEIEALATEFADWASYKEPLVQEVLQTAGREFDGVMSLFNADPRDPVTGLKQVADLLDRKATPAQATNFKTAMLLISGNVAKASGDLAEKISTAEATSFVLIKTALRMPQLETVSAS